MKWGEMATGVSYDPMRRSKSPIPEYLTAENNEQSRIAFESRLCTDDNELMICRGPGGEGLEMEEIIKIKASDETWNREDHEN
jgi:hypothetical protein